MADVVDRQSLLDRLVALEDGASYVREFYGSFSDADLMAAVESAEVAARDVARYGRLGAVWQDAGGEIVISGDSQARPKDAAE